MSGPVPLTELANGQISALVYGATGVGKTAFACGSQKLRTVVLEIDQGTITACCFQGNQEMGIPPTRLELVTGFKCLTFQDVMNAHTWLTKNPRAYDLVVLDTATELQRMVLSEIKRGSGGEVVDQRGWGIALDMMDDLCRSFKALGKHTLFTAHEAAKDDEYERRVMYQPAFQGSFATMYARHFSLIMRYLLVPEEVVDAAGKKHRKVNRALQCQNDRFSHAKDRSGALAMYERPFLDAILDKVQARVQRSLTSPQVGQGDETSEGNTTGARPEPASAPAGHPALGRPGSRKLVGAGQR